MSQDSRGTDFGDHHVAVKCALAAWLSGSRDVGADLGYDGRAEGHVGHEVAVHDVDLMGCEVKQGREREERDCLHGSSLLCRPLCLSILSRGLRSPRTRWRVR